MLTFRDGIAGVLGSAFGDLVDAGLEFDRCATAPRPDDTQYVPMPAVR
jgi:hypothetical protein